jgi:hypothetical protein
MFHRCASLSRADFLARIFIVTSAIFLGAVSSAHAIVQGRETSLGGHMVRVSSRSGHQCTGVAIGRALVVTAAHCGARSVRAGGGAIGVATVTRSAVLDDGRRVSVSGDAAILKLSSPLPPGVSPASVGEGSGDDYTIAGYGATDERFRGSMGGAREASLMPAGRYNLIDPTRNSSISASACYGDSGGPVLRGSQLVGVISRAAHPSPRIACGHITRWAPITASGAVVASADVAVTGFTSTETSAVAPARKHKRWKRRHR